MKKLILACMLAALLAGLCGCGMLVVEDPEPVVISQAQRAGLFT